MRAALLLLLSGCGGLLRFAPPSTLTYSSGWHDCGDGWGCPEFWECQPHRTCEFLGDPSDPGVGGHNLEGSWPGYPPN